MQEPDLPSSSVEPEKGEIEENPPSRSAESKASGGAGLSRKVSWVLDECIQVPATKISFGLDPILGLIPYGGETVATIIGATILGNARKKGLPIRTLLKMSGNMLLNAIVGTVPFAGDLFSVWFKSNTRNYQLLNTYLESNHGEEAPGGWGPFLIVFVSVGLVLILNILTWIFFTAFMFWVYYQVIYLAN